MAVPVLVSKKLNSIFNRILVFLAVFDNVYILCSVLEGRGMALVLDGAFKWCREESED